MMILERITLVDRIGRELQTRMSYSDIDIFLGAHGVNCKGFAPSTNSKRVYVKELLADASEDLVLRIADELELDHGYTSHPKNDATFWRPGHFRLFLSHLASFKVNTTRLQHALRKFAISGFVAHEDIEPSKEWQLEIEAALNTMDAMAALLMPGFKESNWCDQEVGVAVGRGVLIIPVRRNLDPYGFIGKYQGIQAARKNVGEVATEIFETIIRSPKTRTRMLRCISTSIAQSTNLDDALEKVTLLKAQEEIPVEILESLRNNITENQLLIKSSSSLVEINDLLAKHGVRKVEPGGLQEPNWDEEIPF